MTFSQVVYNPWILLFDSSESALKAHSGVHAQEWN